MSYINLDPNQINYQRKELEKEKKIQRLKQVFITLDGYLIRNLAGTSKSKGTRIWNTEKISQIFTRRMGTSA